MVVAGLVAFSTQFFSVEAISRISQKTRLSSGRDFWLAESFLSNTKLQYLDS
jgi:hypothetical protein